MPEHLDAANSGNEELLKRVRELEAAVEEIKRTLAQSMAMSSQGSETSPGRDTTPMVEDLGLPQASQEPEQSTAAGFPDRTAGAPSDTRAADASGYRPEFAPAPFGPPEISIPLPDPVNYRVQTSPTEPLPEASYATTAPHGGEQFPGRSAKPPLQQSQPVSARVISAAETWMPKIGIVIFLFGVVFLFKYAIDRGWVNEQVRVGLGLLFGTGLIGAGLRVNKRRRRFAAVLLGGGVATYYITSYAAYNLFPSLHVPILAVFAFITLVTAAAFLLSLRNNEVVLSIIGVTGGLLTPLALNKPQIELGVVVVYTCLVTAGATAIYLARGWRALLWVTVPCAWGVLIFCYFNYVLNGPDASSSSGLLNRQLLQGSVLFLSLAFWALPVLREVLVCTNPERWSTPPHPVADYLGLSTFMKHQVPILTVTLPAWAFYYSVALWSGASSTETWGKAALGVSLLFAAAYFALKRYPWTSATIPYTHAIVSIGFLTLGISGVLHGDTLLFALALETATLHLIARKAADRGMAIFGDAIFGIVGVWLAVRLLTQATPPDPAWNAHSLTDLAVIAILMAVSFVNRERTVALVMRNAAHLAVMGWLWRELHTLPVGTSGVGSYGHVMLAWAVYFVLVAYVSRRIGDRVTLALAALPFAAVASLLAWRILEGQEGAWPILNTKTLLDVVVLGLSYAALHMAAGVTPYAFHVRITVRTVIQGILAILLWRELIGLPQGDNYVLLAWATYATLLHAVSLFTNKREPAWAAHGLSILTGAWLLAGVVIDLIRVNEDRTPVFSVQGLTSLGVVVLGIAAYGLVRKRGNPPRVNFAYALWLHFAFLGWVWQEIGLIPGGSGNAYVSIVWGVYAVCLVVAGLRYGRNMRLLTCGVTTLFALAAKLFLIDLQYVDAVWRILLFLGFGGFFLVFSYLFQGKIGRPREEGLARVSETDEAEEHDIGIPPDRTGDTNISHF